MRLLFASLLLLLLQVVMGFPDMADTLPNGRRVTFAGKAWPGVAHKYAQGGGALNQFGRDYRNARHTWTEALCRLDSDGDGRTNGEELGDPHCTWKRGDPDPPVEIVTHPGVAEEEEEEL